MKRGLFDLFLLLFVFILPWWVTIFMAIVGLFIFSNFYEFLITAIIIYVISTVPSESFFSNSLYVYAVIIIFYLLVQFLRRHIILYKNEIPFKT